MEKSSSSLKRKRSKKLSKAKVSSRSKKSRKNKSKKVLRREVSLSSYDDSRSLDTSASSSSDDSYRRKRDRSRTRKDEKGRKRKSHGRSSSYHRDSSEDSHYARKKKKAKRKKERGEVRKKLSKKKNIRREASVDLMSDKSQSCSTCQDGSASSDDNRDKKKRGRSERKEKDRRLRRRSRSERSSRYRARSSSCSSENSDEATKEKYAGEKKSRQLRSIITVTKEAEEYGELCGNETREEIANDLDYPYRSDDNNDGGTRRQLDLYTHLASEEKLSVDNEAGDMNVDLNFVEPGLRDRSYSDNSNVKAYSAGTSESAKETSETFGANVNDDDLEKILRQRALENLRKFRGEMQCSAKAPDQKNKIISQVKQPIADKRELVQGKSVVNNAVVGTKFVKRTAAGEETNLFVGRKNLVACLGNNDVILDTNKDISTSAKCDLASARDKVIDSHNHSGTITESTNCNTTNLELIKQTQSPCHDSFLSHKSSNAKLLGTEGDVERNAAKTPQAAIQSIDNIRDDDVSSAENKSNKLQVESNNGSQFEKKTMNVMRDGEMVQVSYKVYIPNKVPALARRQLKR
ncbi:hypothetical protein PHAVU_010G112300 [Phaseolus vulgaris]|uniref:Uncharacterized protein n=1 Tax=Phaseolus vulgaris TaxID=3885 RepID=V7ANI0_PHAVU|nr:hypothetical protein PHAVU_010G112300g [Phaseolus vulgaris]ESW07232.1 hypothetical protein PHAVU_010G112300g [Phaseolus vulgaris]